MPNPWNFLLSLLWLLPWLLIALAALLLFLKKKQSQPLLLQLLGAAGTVLILPTRELIIMILTALRAPLEAFTATRTIMGFLTFALLLLFAVGYAWEKLSRK